MIREPPHGSIHAIPARIVSLLKPIETTAMIAIRLGFLCAMPFVSACASVVPAFDIPRDAVTNEPTVATIVNRVTCELARLVAPDGDYAGELVTGQYEVGIQLDLTVNDTGGLAPTFSYMKPSFNFLGNAKFEQSREQYFSQKLFYSLMDLKDEVEESEKRFRRGEIVRRLTDCPTEIDTNLSGDLGLRQAVVLAFNSDYLNVNAKMADKGAFGGSVNFTVTKNITGVGPTWILSRFKGPGGLASLSEVNTDKLTFAFAVPDHPLTSAQLAARARKIPRSDRSPRTSPQGGATDRLLQQLQINQISTTLMNIRALQ